MVDGFRPGLKGDSINTRLIGHCTMSVIKASPDWCSVTRVPTALTWNDVDNAISKERDARAHRVLKAAGLDESVVIEVKPPNLTPTKPETTVVRWSK